ncbi:EmrB/QacA subfamily drug resistance transporter [Sinomonas atrocyanea]|uniref:EmrB/QacA subfamily drug resistance transporter n=1 Tax=Sinomonas atrocyanea TaxID=37927 RepID=A0A127A349_9MICC|nr:DHA2 family efflux MFS transporter permease subunit [Sinomonas atrocyanea]AMM33723.1 EmrB/QacA subfamily drug resistance transporter [Sinomonas atrocyanea]GEB66419.1 MFS transporter [Sinomonas atrocyanea]GGG74905.1 MFS transporter [Sinomonas atrocyanea]
MVDIQRPWAALWALVIGFFMILIDTTIVSVANPAIMRALGADINAVIWVTSAYLLAYAVPLLITGRLGDRFGPKRVYLIGLVVFTLSSLWCGLSGSIASLIAARVVQGLGASFMTPQTMAVITRIFPPERRGAAMSVWGSTAGVAMLVGPILGGILVDGFGWEWVFYINVPVGVVGFILAARLVPTLPTHSHRFDWLGVVLSGAGMFLVVFGIQEGQTYSWGTISGPLTVWSLIIAGVVVMALFVLWQAVNKAEPLVPLGLFRDRNFSIANLGISTVGFAVTSFGLPTIFYYQLVRGMTPTQSALMSIPLAVFSGALAPFAGRLVDRGHAKAMNIGGMLVFAVGLVLYAVLMTPEQPIWLLLIPSAVVGVANAGIWGPLATLATRGLPPQLAGAGSGIYNTTRQVGAVLGSAAIAALMEARLSAELPTGGHAAPTGELASGHLPAFLQAGFSAAMGQSVLLPAALGVVGLAVALFFVKVPPAVGRPAAAEDTVAESRR